MEGDYVNVIYMVNSDKVTEIDLGKFKNIKKRISFNANKQVTQKIHDKTIEINLNNKKTYILIEGEEIYIKYFTFPKVSENKLYDLINDELNYLYRNEKFIFNYKKAKESKDGIEVIVFYLRAEGLNLINEFVEKQELKAVRLLQVCFLNYYRKIIKEKDYFLFFQYDSNNYMLFVKNNSIYSNEVCHMDEDKKYSKIKRFFVSNYVKANDINKIYIVGQFIKEQNIVKFFEKYGQINFLKDIDIGKITKLIV